MLLFLTPVAVAATVEIGPDFKLTTVSEPDILVTTDQLSVQQAIQARFQKAQSPQISLKAGESLWMRIKFRNSGENTVSLVARYEFPWTDRAEFFVLRSAGDIVATSVAGDTVKGPRKERLPLVRFGLPKHEDLWLFVHVTTVAQAGTFINVYAEHTLGPRVFAEMLAQGVFLGIACMLLIFHLNMYIATRDTMLRSYLVYLLSVSVFIPLRSGVLPQWLLGQYAFVSDTLWGLSVSAAYFTGLGSARALLSLSSTAPRTDRWLKFVQLITLAPAAALLVSRRVSHIAENSVALIVGPPLLLLGIYHVFRRQQYALYFVMGYSVPIVAAILDNLIENGIVPPFAGRNEVLPAAMVIEFLLFAQIIYQKLTDSEIERVRDKERLARLRSELAFASAVQKSLLPAMPQTSGNVTVHGASYSYKPVASDYFDVVQAGENMIGILAIDAGTGRESSLAAALDVSAVRMAFRNSFVNEADPSAVINRMLSILSAVTKGRQFAMTYVMLNRFTGQGRLYCKMNPVPVIVRANGHRELAAVKGLTDNKAVAVDFKLSAGELLVIATAGIAQRVDLVRDRLSLHRRIQKIRRLSKRPGVKISKRPRNDLTLILIEYAPNSI